MFIFRGFEWIPEGSNCDRSFRMEKILHYQWFLLWQYIVIKFTPQFAVLQQGAIVKLISNSPSKSSKTYVVIYCFIFNSSLCVWKSSRVYKLYWTYCISFLRHWVTHFPEFIFVINLIDGFVFKLTNYSEYGRL